MLARALFGILMILSVSANAVELPDWLSGRPPKYFMNRWVESVYRHLDGTYGVSLRQIDELLKAKMGGDVSYKKGDDESWVLTATLKPKTSNGARQLGDSYKVVLTVAPGRFDDTIQVRALSLAGEPANAHQADYYLISLAEAIKREGIE